MAEQDYEIWSVTVPYLSAGDLMNIYFDSANIPTPNRMNWKDAETDAWLKQGRSALNDADRTKAYALVQEKVMREHLWIPVLNINMDQVANKRIRARPHMIYQNTFYKGLDVTSLRNNQRRRNDDARNFDGICGAPRSGRPPRRPKRRRCG